MEAATTTIGKHTEEKLHKQHSWVIGTQIFFFKNALLTPWDGITGWNVTEGQKTTEILVATTGKWERRQI